MARSGRQSPPTTCRHLGLANDPFTHLDDISEEHRCYLWMQRDRIDPDHQKGYCLSDHHQDCPWLQISLPCGRGGGSAWGTGVVSTLAGYGEKYGTALITVMGPAARKAGLALLSFLELVAERLGPRVRSLLLWCGAQLPRVVVGLGGLLSRISLAAAGQAGRAAGGLARSIARPSRVREKTVENEDYSVLMRLGRQANQAGRRRQAHLCFSRASALDPQSEDALLWTAATTDDNEEALDCLERALTINPASGRARTGLEDLSQSIPAKVSERGEEVKAPLTASELLGRGIKALDTGNEDAAYQLFSAATKADLTSETAWFWRAKTAAQLDEVITCLERVMEINPHNEKASASLRWAVDRREIDVERRRVLSMTPPSTVRSTIGAGQSSAPRSVLLQTASLAYLILGLLWVAPVVFPLLDGTLANLYREVMVLPLVEVPFLSLSALGIPSGPMPDWNLFYLVPLVIALLSFVAMEALWGNRRLVAFYMVLVSGTSIIAAGLFVVGQVASLALIASSGVAGVNALIGRIRATSGPRSVSGPRRGRDEVYARI